MGCLQVVSADIVEGNQVHTSQVSNDILRLAKVHLLQQVAHLELHILNHLANVGDVRGIVLNSHVGLHLAHHVSREIESAKGFTVSAEGENDGRCELVVGGAGAVLGIEDVDAVPAARAGGCGGNGWGALVQQLSLFQHEAYPFSVARSRQSRRPCPRGRRSICRPQSTCLCQHDPGCLLGDSAQLPVHVKGLVRLHLHLPYAVARCNALLNGRLELIAPRTAPAVAIAVVVAAEEVALCFGALLHRERDVDGFKQVLLQRGVQGYDVVDVALDVLGVQAAEEVAGAVSGRCRRCTRGGSSQGAVDGVGHAES
jgi:hypothetical protein